MTDPIMQAPAPEDPRLTAPLTPAEAEVERVAEALDPKAWHDQYMIPTGGGDGLFPFRSELRNKARKAIAAMDTRPTGWAAYGAYGSPTRPMTEREWRWMLVGFIGIAALDRERYPWRPAATTTAETFGGETPNATATVEDPHFIRRHGAFFRPNKAGYCTEIAGAGIYSAKEACAYLDVEGLTIHPVRAYASEIAAVLEGAERLRAALTPNASEPATAREVAFSEGQDEAADFIFHELAEALGLSTFTPQDGSESWKGDVRATLMGILHDASVIDRETGERMEAKDVREKALNEAAAVCEADVMVLGDRSMLDAIRDQVAQLVLADKIRALITPPPAGEAP